MPTYVVEPESIREIIVKPQCFMVHLDCGRWAAADFACGPDSGLLWLSLKEPWACAGDCEEACCLTEVVSEGDDSGADDGTETGNTQNSD
jgi:hypothetical protein